MGNISNEGLRFIARFEGLRAQPYTDPAGHCTVGYGHLLHRGACNGSEPRISQGEALELLRQGVATAERAVAQFVTVPLNQNQRDALVSFTFNVGVGALGRSALLTRLNAGDYAAVPRELKRWIWGGGKVLPGLVTRRAEEGELFMRPVPAPEPELPPVAEPLPTLEALDGVAAAARWHSEEATRELEAGDSAAARARLVEEITPRLYLLERGILL